MPNQQNVKAVKELEAKVGQAQAIFLANYAGLTVKEQVKLRQAVQAAGGELTVAKNSLLKIALNNSGIDTAGIDADLTGPNITLIALTDAVAPLKALVEFAKGSDKSLPAVKSGILGKEILSMEKVIQLSKLPSKLELIAKLLGTLTNPARNLVNVLSAPTRNLVYALNAISKK